MADVINLRTVRKRAKRQADEQRACANRIAYGQDKHLRELGNAQHEKSHRNLDQHMIDKGDGR